jgi:integrase
MDEDHADARAQPIGYDRAARIADALTIQSRCVGAVPAHVLDAVVEAAGRCLPGESVGGIGAARNQALLMVARSTGARVSELQRMSSRDIDVLANGRMLIILGDEGDTRLMPLEGDASAALERWLEARRLLVGDTSPWLWCTISRPDRGRRLTRASLWEITARAAARAGYGQLGISLHTFRASKICELAEAGHSAWRIATQMGYRSEAAARRAVLSYGRPAEQTALKAAAEPADKEDVGPTNPTTAVERTDNE